MNDPALRAAVLTLAGFVLVALLLAVVSILPKYRALRIAPEAKLPPLSPFFSASADSARAVFGRVADKLNPTLVYNHGRMFRTAITWRTTNSVPALSYVFSRRLSILVSVAVGIVLAIVPDCALASRGDQHVPGVVRGVPSCCWRTAYLPRAG